jgi:hypothetical protein
MFAAGTGVLATGLEAEGSLAPGSAAILQEAGESIANRMQDRWWKHEYENWKNTSLQRTQMQTQQLQMNMAESMKEAGKIKDINERRIKMNEIRANTLMQYHSLQEALFDTAMEFPNNPFINQHNQGIMQQTSQTFQEMSGIPAQGAELAGQEAQIDKTQAATAQTQAQTADMPRQAAVEQRKLGQEDRRLDIMEKGLSLKGAKQAQESIPLFNRVMSQAHPVSNPKQAMSQLRTLPGGMELFAQFEGEAANDLLERVNENYALVAQGQMTEDEFRAIHKSSPYDFFDKDSGEFNQENFLLANRSEIREEAALRPFRMVQGGYNPPPAPEVPDTPEPTTPAAKANEYEMKLQDLKEENKAISGRIKEVKKLVGTVPKGGSQLFGDAGKGGDPEATKLLKQLETQRARIRKEEKATRKLLREQKSSQEKARILNEARGTLSILRGE